MLPIYICKWDNDWEWEFDFGEPTDYSKPLSKKEMGEFLSFLNQFSQDSKQESKLEPEPVPETKEEEKTDDVEEDWSDDEEFFEEEGLDILYTPSEEGE